MAIRAPHQRASWHDAFDAQMALWRWYRSPMGRLYVTDSMRANAGALSLDDTRNLIVTMYGSERTRLLDTDPIYVSAEMCEVIEAASESFAPEPLIESDLITPRGFMFFERPFLVPDRFDDPTTIAGASWNRLFHGDKESAADVNRKIEEWKGNLVDLEEQMLSEDPRIEPWGIALTVYCSTKPYLDHIGDVPHGVRIRELYPGNIPPLVPLHLTPWYFNMTFEGNEWDLIGQPTGAEWWWRIIQTSFRLMQQRVAVKHLRQPERHARKEMRRLGGRPETDVVVVRLRREAGETNEPTGESANYSHRFIVGGFWRNQWYPSVKTHRQIWINPYIKGDPSLPLIIRPKRVYQWDR